LMPKMLDKSRFNRRWHRLFLPLLDLFDYLASVLKAINSSSEYLLYQFLKYRLQIVLSEWSPSLQSKQ
jgi:hypothetical protein